MIEIAVGLPPLVDRRVIRSALQACYASGAITVNNSCALNPFKTRGLLVSIETEDRSALRFVMEVWRSRRGAPRWEGRSIATSSSSH